MVTEIKYNPEVLWAQRNDLIYLTVCVRDGVAQDFKVDKNSLELSAVDKTQEKNFYVKLNFYAEIKPETVKQNKSGQGFYFVIEKEQSGPYWPRLLKDNVKCHWLKTDFSKWKDEDDDEDESAPNDMFGNDFSSMMSGMGGMGGMEGMEGMGGMGGLDGMGDFGNAGEDSDDELPDPEHEAEEEKHEHEQNVSK